MVASDHQEAIRKNCDYCVEKKIRCSGRVEGEACVQCERKNHPCVFSLKLRPGPKCGLHYQGEESCPAEGCLSGRGGLRAAMPGTSPSSRNEGGWPLSWSPSLQPSSSPFSLSSAPRRKRVAAFADVGCHFEAGGSRSPATLSDIRDDEDGGCFVSSLPALMPTEGEVRAIFSTILHALISDTDMEQQHNLYYRQHHQWQQRQHHSPHKRAKTDDALHSLHGPPFILHQGEHARWAKSAYHGMAKHHAQNLDVHPETFRPWQDLLSPSGPGEHRIASHTAGAAADDEVATHRNTEAEAPPQQQHQQHQQHRHQHHYRVTSRNAFARQPLSTRDSFAPSSGGDGTAVNVVNGGSGGDPAGIADPSLRGFQHHVGLGGPSCQTSTHGRKHSFGFESWLPPEDFTRDDLEVLVQWVAEVSPLCDGKRAATAGGTATCDETLNECACDETLNEWIEV